MKKYIQPDTEIIAATTSQRLLLDGSHVVNDLTEKEQPDIVGGDEANTFKRGLWDENE